MAAVSAYVEAYAAAATGAFVHAEARALAKDRDDAAAVVISAFIGEVVAATRRDAASAALAEVAASSTPDPKAAAWTPFEEFAAEVVAVIDAAGGAMLASKLPEAYEAKYGKPLDFKALGFASMSALAPRIPGVGVHDGHDPAKTVLTTEDNVYDLATIERRILEIVDGRYGLVTLNNLQRLYKDHHGHELDHAALGFGQLLDLIRSLRGLEAPAHGSKGNRKIRRAPAPVRILQRPAAAPAPAAAQRRLSGDAGEFRPASPAPAPMYAQPPIPPPPHGFVPVFAPPPPLFVPVFPGERLAWPPPPGAPPPLPGAPILMPIGGMPPANWRRGGGMHYAPNQPEPDNEG